MTQEHFTEADEDWFWQIIHDAGGDKERLRQILHGLSKEEVYRFQDIFVEMATELQDEPYTMYVGEDESEDGIADIANWVVSQGKEAYQSVLNQPDRMPEHVELEESSDLFGAAYEVYYARFGEGLDVM